MNALKEMSKTALKESFLSQVWFWLNCIFILDFILKQITEEIFLTNADRLF